MLIVSWNVAGLKTTAERIHENYFGGATAAASSSADSNGDDTPAAAGSAAARAGKNGNGSGKIPPSEALRYFFQDRHGADIVCLQEHKIPRKQLSERCEPRQASSLAGYESFWSCCTDKGYLGLNGVVTYAKRGSVRRADAMPLGSPDLDGQGRCVVTDHGAFVLFNVYVPASGGQPLSYKMKFLSALRRAMQRERQQNNKPVILVGDLNISHRANDVYWKNRAVYVDDILEEVRTAAAGGNSGSQAQLPRWKHELAENWSAIEAALETKEVLPTKTKNTKTGAEYSKFRLAVTVKDRRVYLGGHETAPEYCAYGYDFSPCSYVDSETGEEIAASAKNVVRLCILEELMSKIIGIRWDEDTLRQISALDSTSDGGEAKTKTVSPTRQWLNSVLEEDGMVDAFRYFYPKAEGRFTCWNQSMNCRYNNEGSRIDYTLIDRSLLERVRKGDVESLRVGDGTPSEQHLTEAAALAAATANGRFRPAAFEGGGITEATMDVLNTQFGPPHTGMIYTPPTFSDHIAISLLMDDNVGPTNQALDENDIATKRAQPHKSQKTIADFFRSGTVKTKRVLGENDAAKKQAQPQKARKTIADFFIAGADKPASKAKSAASKTRPAKDAPLKGTIFMSICLLSALLLLSVSENAYAFVPSAIRGRASFYGGLQQLLQRSHTTSSSSSSPALMYLSSSADNEEDEEGDAEKGRRYSDPNFPELEFVDYSDPNYQANQGDALFAVAQEQKDTTEEEIEAMREDRRKKNDEFQFETYFAEILKNGDEYKGEWTVYKTSTFLNDAPPDENGLPRLVKAGRPLKVVSRGYKEMIPTDSPYPVDSMRICHDEISVTDSESDPYKSWQADVDTDTGFGRHAAEDNGKDDKDDSEKLSPEAIKTESEIMGNKYWPDKLTPYDFRGQQGIMVCGKAYTIAVGVPHSSSTELDTDPHTGPFSEYRAEIGIQSKQLRFRLKLDYSIKESDKRMETPPLHLKSLTVCREAREMWPRSGKMKSVADRMGSEALFGVPGADGGLYDPPPVGSETQASQYLMLDLEGRATALFPYLMDQDPEAHDGGGWVFTLDWTPGTMRYQVDRKVKGGKKILGVKTLELSEVQSADAETYRPRDGGRDMRQ